MLNNVLSILWIAFSFRILSVCWSQGENRVSHSVEVIGSLQLHLWTHAPIPLAEPHTNTRLLKYKFFFSLFLYSLGGGKNKRVSEERNVCSDSYIWAHLKTCLSSKTEWNKRQDTAAWVKNKQKTPLTGRELVRALEAAWGSWPVGLEVTLCVSVCARVW